MARDNTLELITDALFNNEKRLLLTVTESATLERIRDVYTFWLEKPTFTDTNIRDYLMVNFSISKSQAYRDIGMLKTVLGNVPTASKEFHRYKVNHILDEAHAAAIAGNDHKAKALTKVAEIYAYNNRTNEDDGDKLPFGDIIPRDVSFTLDPTAAGVIAVPGLREKADKLYNKYKEEIELDTNTYAEYETDIPE